MLKIYFDDVLIDSDNYMSLKVNDKLFDKSFILGSVPSETLTLEVPSSFSIPEKVKIMQDDVNYGFYNVDKAEYKNDTTLKLTLIDNVILTEKPYDARTLFPNEGETTTTKAIFEDICNKAGIPYDSSGFTINDNIPVNYYDTSIKGRQYLSYLAELNGGYISQNKDGEICFNRYKWSKNLFSYPYKDTTKTINGITFTDNGDGSITINGTATAQSIFYLSGSAWSFKESEIISEGTYTFNQISNNPNIFLCLNIYATDNTNAFYSSADSDKTFTITGIKSLGYPRIVITSGTQVDNLKVYPQLEVGDKKTSFSPYVENSIYKHQTLLNTEYCENFKLGEKHQIERVVYDNGKVKFAKARKSKNLFNFNNFSYEKKSASVVSYNILSSNSIEVYTNNTGGYASVWFEMNVDLPDGYVVLSASAKDNDETTGTVGIGIEQYPIGSTTRNNWYEAWISQNDRTNNIRKAGAKILIDNSQYYYKLRVFGNQVDAVANHTIITDIMIEQSETMTDYESYDLSEDENIETLYLNPLNPYINDQETVDNIADQIIGFEYYNFSTKNCPIDIYAKAGDVLRITDGENEYSSIIQYELKYNGTWLGGYSLNLDSKIQQETVVVGDSPEMRSVRVVINRVENEVLQQVSDLNDVKGNITTIQQNQSSINQSVIDLKRGYFPYNLTSDTTFQNAKEYYYYNEELQQYQPYTYNSINQTYTDNQGNTYHVGDTIPTSTVYEQGNFVEGVDGIKETVNTLTSSFSEQTAQGITDWFTTHKIDDKTYGELLSSLNTQMDDVNSILTNYAAYIRRAIDDAVPKITTDTEYQQGVRYYKKINNEYVYQVPNEDYNIGDTISGTVYTSLHFGDPYIELGENNYQTKIRIYPDEVVFYTDDNRTAYISNDSLYIEESTILTKEQVGHWLTYEDNHGNLNTKWVND